MQPIQTLTILQLIGMLVLTSTITAICATMVKEKIASNGKVEKVNDHSRVCPFHHSVDSRLEEGFKKFDEYKVDIGEIKDQYHKLNTKLEVFMARDEEKIQSINNFMDTVKVAMTKLHTETGD